MKKLLDLRTLALGVLAVLGSAAGLYLALSWQPEQEARRGFEARARSIARILATTVKPAVEFDDKEALARDLQLAGVDEASSAAVVLRSDGSPVAGFNAGAVPEAPGLRGPAVAAQDVGDVHLVAVPLPIGKQLGHWLVVATPLESLRKGIAGTRSTAALVAVLWLLLGLVLSALFARNTAARARILEELLGSASKLRSSSADLRALSTEQASSTAEQRAAVEETRRTMESLLDSARRIAEASQAVFSNAQRTAKTTADISEATRGLVGHAQRIGEISETIRGIADRSDLLALNAALEGTKAGEAGRGFSLVAVEMRRLAENVMGAVREIKQLVGDIRLSSTTTVAATEEGARLAQHASESAHEITVVTQQQRAATEQVTQSMDEVRKVLEDAAAGVKRAATVSADLVQLADVLGHLAEEAARGTGAGARA